MEKTRKELEKEYAEATIRLEQAQHEAQRLENRVRYIGKIERRARNHRLITRGAAVEHLWPQAKPMTESAFYELMEAVLSLPEAKAILNAHRPKADGDP